MEKTLEQRIKDLERELALKNAYLNVQISFPKGNKLPEDVKDQVVNELKAICTKLAENKEVNVDTSTTQASQFTDEEVSILKLMAEMAMKKRDKIDTRNSSTMTKDNVAVREEAAPQPESVDVGLKKAVIITLENVNPMLRKKMAPQEEVYVKSVKGDKACIINKHGQTGYVPVEDLEYV